MKNYLIALVLSLGFATVGSAHGGIKIKADKVIFNQGISKSDIVSKMQCLLILKKVKENKMDKHEVYAKKMEKINNMCAKHDIDKKKCDHIKKHIAMKLHDCFVGARFVKEFFGMHKSEEVTAPEAAPVQASEAK